jgi:hypothetical protein
VGRERFSPVRSHSENGSDRRLRALLHGSHSPYDYDEVLSR